jgi:hypothetical protein
VFVSSAQTDILLVPSEHEDEAPQQIQTQDKPPSVAADELIDVSHAVVQERECPLDSGPGRQAEGVKFS